ncbi:MAG: MoxR-like ATPase [Acidimicrobiaceae bacterium]
MVQRAPGAADAAVEEAGNLGRSLLTNLRAVIRGKDDVLGLALVAVLSGGHLLIEDVPGVGKTLLAKALARSMGGLFRRVQATPDLLPADLTGISVLAGAGWEFRPGPLFGNVVLVDEINRATPRTQSALLEAMEERQVTADGTTHPLPEPFFLVATQNPFEHAGTFPLVEGQRDRFAIVVELGHPGRRAERELLLGQGGTAVLDQLESVTDPAALARAQAAVRAVHCRPEVADYVIDVADATRRHADVTIGASPRATLGLLHAAQAHAVMANRAFVTPSDVQAVAPAALAHRLILAGGLDLHAGSALVRALLEDIAVPTG